MVNGIQPFALANAMVPAVVALIACRAMSPREMPSIVVAVALVALIGVHPSAAATSAVLGLFVVAEIALARREIGGTFRALALPAVISAVLAWPWLGVRSGTGPSASAVVSVLDVDAVASPMTGVYMAMSFHSPWSPPQALLAAFVLTGLILCVIERRGLALVATWIFFAVLFVAAVAGVGSFQRLSWPWFGEWWRLLAVLGILAPVFAAVSAARLTETVIRHVRTRSAVGVVWAVIGTLSVVAVLAQGAQYVLSAHHQVLSAWHDHGFTTLSDLRVYKRLRVVVPHDSLVLNRATDGSTWMYASASVKPAFPYVNAASARPELARALDNLRTLHLRPRMCSSMLENSVAAVVARRRDVYGQLLHTEADLQSNPVMFHELAREGSTSAFLVNQAALERCAESEP